MKKIKILLILSIFLLLYASISSSTTTLRVWNTSVFVPSYEIDSVDYEQGGDDNYTIVCETVSNTMMVFDPTGVNVKNSSALTLDASYPICALKSFQNSTNTKKKNAYVVGTNNVYVIDVVSGSILCTSAFDTTISTGNGQSRLIDYYKDGTPSEIIFADANIQIFNESCGNIVKKGYGNAGRQAYLKVGDLDGDGYTNEGAVINQTDATGGRLRQLDAFNSTGDIQWTKSLLALTSARYLGLEIKDITLDAGDEVITFYSYSGNTNITLFDSVGTFKKNYRTSTTQFLSGEVMVGDFDSDGTEDDIVAIGGSDYGGSTISINVTAVTKTGTLLWQTDTGVMGEVTDANYDDIDDDGKKEIIIGTNLATNNVLILNNSGSLLLNFTAGGVGGSIGNEFTSMASILLNDLDGDGVKDIILSVENAGLDIFEVVVPTDITPPIITIISPINITYATTTIDFNVSLDEDTNWCGFSLDGAINVSMTAFNTTYFNYTNSTMTQGNHNVTFACNDTVGNMNASSGIRVFSIDSVFPTISINYPPNNTNTSNTQLHVNYTAIDTNLDDCWYSNDTMGLNTTLTNCANITTVTWTEGSHTVKVWANDSANNKNSSSISFTIDTTAPVTTATMTSPPDGASYTNNTWTKNNTKITLTSFDSGVGYNNLAFPIYCNDTSNTCDPSTFISSGVTITSEGTNYIRFYSNDTLSNKEATQSRTLKIDKSLPSLTLAYPTNNQNFTYNTSINLNFSVADSLSGIANCTYSLDNGANTTIQGCINTTINVSQGNHNLSLFVNDTAGNINSSSISFTSDSTNPSITLISPTNNTWNTSKSIIFVGNATESIGNLANCSLFTNETSWNRKNTNTSCTSGTNCKINNTFTNDGIYMWNFECCDNLGNCGFNQTNFTLKIDSTNPSIALISPINNTWDTDGSISFQYTPTDSNLDDCSLYLNYTGWKLNTTNSTPTSGSQDTITLSLPNGTYVWNVWCNDSAGNSIFNNTNYTIKIDSSTPSITLNNPYNATYLNSSSVTFNYTPSGTNLDDCVLYGNFNGTWHSNQTNSSPTSGSPDIITLTLNNANYTWNVQCNNSAGTVGWAVNQTFIVDTTYPIISFNQSTESNNTWKQVNYIFINVTAYDLNNDTIKLEFNGTNQSFTNRDGNYSWINKSSLVTGSYLFYAWMNDSAGNFNKTATYNVSIDLEDPSVTIILPQTTSYNNNLSIALNYSATDSYLSNCWFNLDNGTNITIANCLNTTFNSSEATHTLYLYVNDSSGRVGVDEVTFTVNLAPPAVTLTAPLNNAWINYKQNVNFNYTPIDTALDTCEIWTNMTGTWQINQTNSSPTANVTNTFYINLSDKSYIWNVYCNDTGGNSIWGSTPLSNYTVKVDTTYPTISFSGGTPDNNTNSTATSIFINVSANDLNFDSITYSLYNSSHTINSTKYTTLIQNITFTNLLDYEYYYNVTINDSAGNINSTTTRIIKLDDTKPTITILHPLAQNYAYNNSIALNYTATDNLIGLDECWYYVYNSSGSLIIPLTILSTCQNTSFNLSGNNDIDYTLTLFASDLLGNTQSSTVTFGIRMVAPAIVLDNPTNYYFFNRLTNLNFNFTPTDSDGLTNCELWGNWSGTWAKNQTLTSITSGIQTNFSLVSMPSDESRYIWNVWCNDTLNNSGFALNNLTFFTDTVAPVINLTSPTATTYTSLDVSLQHTETDYNISQCKYDYTIGGATAGNTSVACNANQTISFTVYGRYVFDYYVIDGAGNTNSTSFNFTINSPSGSTGGGSGGIPIEEKIVCNTSNEQYDITTATGIREGYTIILGYKTTKPIEKLIYVTNYGLNNLTLSFECEKTDNNTINICDYIKLSDNETLVYPNPEEKEIVVMEIKYPEGATTQDTYSFNIVSNSDHCQVNLNNIMYINRFSISKYKSLKLSSFNPDYKDFNYPVVILGLICWMLVFILGSIISRVTRKPVFGIFLIGFIGGFAVLMFVMLI